MNFAQNTFKNLTWIEFNSRNYFRDSIITFFRNSSKNFITNFLRKVFHQSTRILSKICI